MRLFALGVTLCSFALTLAAADDQDIARAKTVFEKYQALERAYDPDLADLYSDNARIENTRFDSAGKKESVAVPAADYKKLIRSAMPTVKARGVRDEYSNVQFAKEERGIRIHCARLSTPSLESGTLSLLVGPVEGGEWKILEEFSESKK